MIDFFALLDYVWNVSISYSKYILFALLIWTFYKTRKIEGINFLQQAFVRELFSLGEFIVLGFVIGGVVGIFSNNFFIASIFTIAVILFGFYKPKKIERMPEISVLKERTLYIFLILGLLITIASIATNFIALNSFAALFLYGILFWRV